MDLCGLPYLCPTKCPALPAVTRCLAQRPSISLTLPALEMDPSHAIPPGPEVHVRAHRTPVRQGQATLHADDGGEVQDRLWESLLDHGG